MPHRLRSLVSLLMIPAMTLLALFPQWSRATEELSLATKFVAPGVPTGMADLPGRLDQQRQPTPAMLSVVPGEPPDHELVRLANQERLKNGLPPLKAAPELMDAAQFHSDWMADHNCFDHNCPGEPIWTQRLANAGYLASIALGENIAAWYTTASGAVQAWMNSTMGHRENMLNPAFREAGGGYTYSATSQHHHYWTLDLGARTNVYPVVVNNEAWSTSSLEVNLYVYGRDWANQTRFSNDGIAWSEWEPFSSNKLWTLSCPIGSLTTLHAQITNGSTTLGSSDSIHADIALRARPDLVVFLAEQGATTTVPAFYQMTITSCGPWTAQATQAWIRLGETAGSGPASVEVYLEGALPAEPGLQSGTINVSTTQGQASVQVNLMVTTGPLQRTHLPLAVKNRQ